MIKLRVSGDAIEHCLDLLVDVRALSIVGCRYEVDTTLLKQLLSDRFRSMGTTWLARR